MKRLLAVALIGVAAGAAGAALDPVRSLAGRYSDRFQNGLVDGETYWSDEVAEIVPVDATHAYVRFVLAFYNGHSCHLAGVAERQGDALVYQAPPGGTSSDGQRCRLVIRRHAGALAWDDDGTCKAFCGARGSFLNGGLPWASKRPITYLTRLRRSSTYRDALIEWRTGKAAD